MHVGLRLILAVVAVRAIAESADGIEEDDLRNASTDNEGDRVVAGVVRDLHRPAVDVADVAPSAVVISDKIKSSK